MKTYDQVKAALDKKDATISRLQGDKLNLAAQIEKVQKDASEKVAQLQAQIDSRDATIATLHDEDAELTSIATLVGPVELEAETPAQPIG